MIDEAPYDRFPGPEAFASERPIGTCADCGEDIYPDETVYSFPDGSVLCAGCVNAMSPWSILDRLGEDPSARATKDLFTHTAERSPYDA